MAGREWGGVGPLFLASRGWVGAVFCNIICPRPHRLHKIALPAQELPDRPASNASIVRCTNRPLSAELATLWHRPTNRLGNCTKRHNRHNIAGLPGLCRRNTAQRVGRVSSIVVADHFRTPTAQSVIVFGCVPFACGNISVAPGTQHASFRGRHFRFVFVVFVVNVVIPPHFISPLRF